VRVRIAVAALGIALLLAGLAAAAAPRPTVLGVSWEANGMLARLDAQTLRPVGRRLDIGRPPTGLLARSPDGHTIALGHGSTPALRFVDLRTMRASGRLRVAGLGSILDGIWPSPGRLIALRAGTDPAVVVVDPRARRVLGQTPLDGEAVGAIARKGRLVFLLTPKGAIGPARLGVVGSDGSVGVVALRGVEAGFAPPPDEHGTGRQASPGVAVDPTGTRAAVVTLDSVLVVDLDRLEVTQVHRSITRAPARARKFVEGWGRPAIWVRDDAIAVFGWRYAVEGKRFLRASTGVELVDVKSGRTRMLDPTATRATTVGDTLLTFGGTALRGHSLAGDLRFEVLRGRDTGYLQTTGRWVYVGRDNSTLFSVVDARAGRVVGTARTPNPTVVLGSG
jgi:hypothetical protein